MRISEFLRVSFVGALLFSPAMAEDVEQVHAEALRVLREKLGQSNSGTLSTITPAPSGGDIGATGTKADREARIKAEAQARMAERERAQAERRHQFEDYVKERERLRQEQRQYDENAARQTGVIRQDTENEVHARALQELHRVQAQQLSGVLATPQSSLQQGSQWQTPGQGPAASASPAQAPNQVTQRLSGIAPENRVTGNVSSAAGTLTEAEVAPRAVAGASGALAPASNDVHTRALEVLRQQGGGTMVGTPTTTVSGPSSSPAPSPELQQRLKQMQAELEAPQTRRPSGITDAYIRDLEARARENVGSTGLSSQPAASGGVAGLPGLDQGAREILQRQDRQISERVGTTQPGAVLGGQATAAPSPASIQPQVPYVAGTPVAATPNRGALRDTSNVEYSRELEERARQILLERSQNPNSAVVASPATPSVPPVAANPSQTPPSSPIPSGTPSVAPVVSSTAPVGGGSGQTLEDVHARALQTLNQIQPGEGARTLPKNKQQRLRDLTDLYRADKIGPAEYHQKRAQILAEP